MNATEIQNLIVAENWTGLQAAARVGKIARGQKDAVVEIARREAGYIGTSGTGALRALASHAYAIIRANAVRPSA